MPVVAPSTKEQIVRPAERLFAEHGLDGVSLRKIAAAAGNANNSVDQYHVGSKGMLFAVEVASLLDGIVGFLEAPVSVEAQDAADGAGPAIANWAARL